MVLSEENCESKINALEYRDWQPLLALIPRIETSSSFSEWDGGEQGDDGAFQPPYCVMAPVVCEFEDLVYGIPIAICFSWAKWDKGRGIPSDKDFDFDSIDLVEKCKLITAIVRNDRFCDGP